MVIFEGPDPRKAPAHCYKLTAPKQRQFFTPKQIETLRKGGVVTIERYNFWSLKHEKLLEKQELKP